MIVAVSLVPFVGALISLGVWLATLVLPSRRTREGLFIGLASLCTGLWMVSYGVSLNLRTWFEVGSSAYERMGVFWFVVASFASAGVALYWFLFAMENAGYRRWTTGWMLWAQHALAILISLSYATAPVQGWAYQDYVPGDLVHAAGPLQPFADAVLYVWPLVALVVFVSTASKNSAWQLRRLAYVVAVLGSLVLLGSAVWSYRDALGVAPSIDPGLMLMPLLNAAMVYYVSRAGLLEFTSVSASSTFANLADAAIIADHVGRIVSFNDAARRIFPDVSSTDSIGALLGAAGLPAAEYEAWDRGSGELLEFEVVAGDRPYWARVAPMSGRYRWQNGTLVLATDISRLREAECEVREANRQLVEAQAARERFLRNVGRELRSPLETIIGMSGVLLQELPGPLNEEQRSQLALVEDSGNRLLQVFDRILHLAAAQEDQLDIRYGDVDVCVLVTDVVRSLRPVATRKSISLLHKSNLPECRIRCDAGHLRSILDNLVSNAVEYTDEGTVTVATFLEGTWIDIDIADTGRGIPAALRERVFEEFGHAESEDPGSPELGAHIGLALSRRLARRLGGDITVDSTPGIGSRFRLRLPFIDV